MMLNKQTFKYKRTLMSGAELAMGKSVRFTSLNLKKNMYLYIYYIYIYK